MPNSGLQVVVGPVFWVQAAVYGTFRLNSHRFDRFEPNPRGHTQPWGAALSCLRLKWADMALI